MTKKLSATTCETVKPNPLRDRLIGDGDGLFLQVRPHGTKTWVIEYEFQGSRTKYTIGGYSRNGAPGESRVNLFSSPRPLAGEGTKQRGFFISINQSVTGRTNLPWERVFQIGFGFNSPLLGANASNLERAVKLPPAKPGAYWVSPSKGPVKP